MRQVIEDRVPYWLAATIVFLGVVIAASATWVTYDSLNGEDFSLRGRIGEIAAACALLITALLAFVVGVVGYRRVAIEYGGNLLLITRFGYALKRCLMFGGWKSRPAGVVPAGSNWRGGGGDKAA